jgi:16S rRNA (uracil1498-N3)-methyltransferase
MLFYLPEFHKPVLPETESMHCVKVLRKGKGDTIRVTDGLGNMADARITDPNPKRCGLELLNPIEKPKDWEGNVWLAVAPTKNLDRMEWLVEKATEIGCDGFLFVRTARTERDHLNLERLQKVALSAMKQSGQASLPDMIWAPKWNQIPWEKFDRILTADLTAHNPEWKRDLNSRSLLFIGPEGDFTPQELDDLKQHQAESIRLRPQVLRTETAALYALMLAHV